MCAGTPAGGKRAAITNKKRHGEDFYKRIAKMASHPGTGGFAANPALAKIAGAKGGRLGKRGLDPRILKIMTERKDLIIEMRKNGYSDRDISETIGIKYQTVYNYRKRWNIK